MDQELQDIVLGYPKIKERLESKDNAANDRKKILKNLDEIRAEFSDSFIQGFSKTLDTVLPKLYDGMNIKALGYDFKKLSEDYNVVLVPNHQSHADYLAINYQVYKQYGVPLYVAGGINLNIFPLGKIFKKSGCFFIRRSFANDILYRLTLEAYLYYLLIKGKTVEFFFEGGRSRSGKLMAPRFGLYHMLLEAHSHIEEKDRRDFRFVPVSIVHEYVPETKSLARELRGGKKKKESTGQLFGLFKLLGYQFGNVHINLGRPVKVNEEIEDVKKRVQDLAFECFRTVGRNMMVTPTSLLALIMLDEPTGAVKWNDLLRQARAIMEYCEKFNVPVVDSLKGEELEPSLHRALDIMIGNDKIDQIGRHQAGKHIFYAIKEESRQELLYFKNTILHHFMLPWTINLSWIKIFQGSVETVLDLKWLFLLKREQLKHEFYLPTTKEFFKKTFEIISWCVEREIRSLDECMNLTHKELYRIISKLGVFSRACNFLMETYYVTGKALLDLQEAKPDGFKWEEIDASFKENFSYERELEKAIRFPEAYSQPVMKNALKYFDQLEYVKNDKGLYSVSNIEAMASMTEEYYQDLTEQMRFNLRGD